MVVITGGNDEELESDGVMGLSGVLATRDNLAL